MNRTYLPGRGDSFYRPTGHPHDPTTEDDWDDDYASEEDELCDEDEGDDE